jgi:putative sporulation protein YtxC
MKQLVITGKYNISTIIDDISAEATALNISQTDYSVTKMTSNTAKIKYNTQIGQLITMIGKAIAYHIIDNYAPKIINRILKAGSNELWAADIKDIMALATNDVMARRAVYVTYLQNEIVSYIKGAAELNIEGYAAFRLSDFTNKLKPVTDSAVDRFFNETAESEFEMQAIEFVTGHQSFCNEAHIVYNDGEYRILNDKSEDITDSCCSGYEEALKTSKINKKELLLSVLLTLAPQKLILYNTNQWPDSKFVTKLSSVFGSNVTTVSL